jgi:hypothetical protein
VLAGENPYGDDIVRRIHEGMFGAWYPQEQIVQRFAYPAIIAWLLLPFWLLPFPVAVSLWCGLQLLIMLALPLLVASLLDWRPRMFVLALVLFLSVFGYRYPITAYVLGQFTPLALACLVAGWWGLARGRALVATLALLGAVIRPEVASFPLLVLLLAAWRAGYRRVVALWGGLLAGLWVLTRVRIGPWVVDFLTGTGEYATTSFLRWPPLVFGTGWIAALVVVAVLAWAVLIGWRVRCLPAEMRLPWEVALVTVVVLVLLPQTNNYTLVVGLLPAWVALWAAGRGVWGTLLVLFVLLSPWVFFLAADRLPAGLEQLLVPVALGGVLTVGWFLREGEAKGEGL